MKGLILKDIYGVKAQILGGIALLFLPHIIVILAGGGMAVDDSGMLGDFAGIFLYGLMNYVTIVLCSSFVLNTLGFDEKSGWMKMQRAMPVTETQIIVGKLLSMGVILGILLGISLIGNAVGMVVFGIPAEPLITMPFAAAFLQAMVLSVCFTLGYRFGSKSTLLYYIAAQLVIAAGLVLLIVGVVGGIVTPVILRVIVYGAIPILTAAVIAVCCKCGKKAVMRDI